VEKRETFGFILIGLILMVWMMYIAPTPQQPPQRTIADSQSAPYKKPLDSVTQKIFPQDISIADSSDDRFVKVFGNFFAPFAQGTEKIIHIENELFSAEFTSKGGMLKKWTLKKFSSWSKKRLVQLVENTNLGDLSLLFSSTEGKIINTNALYFQTSHPASHIDISSSDADEYTLEFVLPVSETSTLIRKYIFKRGEYGFRTEQHFIGMQNIIAGDEYQLVWERGIRFTEYNSVDEAEFAQAIAYSGGELKTIDAASSDEFPKSNFSGTTEWVGTHNKYFGFAILSNEQKSVGGYLEGKHITVGGTGMKEEYKVAMKLPFKGNQEERCAETIFLGPLDRDILLSYDAGLDQMLSLGWAWIVRPISEYVLLPIFYGLHYVIPNYGIVLIVFSIIIKILLHPLTKKSMDSMRKMQKLQPMMAELKEKHKEDPTKMNQAVMRLYTDYGVNPAGGCLPIILQMPILFALFSVFRSTIDLRQAHFVGWIHDLSMPDVLFTLPFSVPIFNSQEISGLALMLGITQFWQSKQTTTDPRQKMMVWMMPVMMFFLFNSFPSGLNLYYTLFNLLSIAQQWLVNKSHNDEPLKKIEPKNRKLSWFERLAKQAQETRRGKK